MLKNIMSLTHILMPMDLEWDFIKALVGVYSCPNRFVYIVYLCTVFCHQTNIMDIDKLHELFLSIHVNVRVSLEFPPDVPILEGKTWFSQT